jgi:hypothetical protein
MTIRLRLLAILAFLLFVSLPADLGATETCGNTNDDDSDDMTDEGCWPAAVPGVGVCESPLGCGQAGSVAPVSGSLVHAVMPDLAPGVAFGPALIFQRTYQSQYAPSYFGGGSGATDYKAPLGYRWHHSFMSWVRQVEAAEPGVGKLVLHLPSGQDVYATEGSSDSSYVYYQVQPGWHFKEVKQSKTSPYPITLTFLTGERYEYTYDGSLQVFLLDKMKDTLATANYIDIDYSGGQVSTVTAADGKQLQFSYFSSGTKVLQYVKYYAGGSERVAVELKYYEPPGDTTNRRKLTEVWIASTKVESYSYDANDFVSAVLDGGGKQVAAFRYRSSSPYQLVSVETPAGDMGFLYGVSGCDSGETGTHMTFHRKEGATACDTSFDGTDECASGYYCGGETNPSADNTGICFQARRLVCSTSPNEDLVKLAWRRTRDAAWPGS